MISMSLTKTGLLNPAELTAWKRNVKQGIHEAVSRGMQKSGAQIAEQLRANVKSSLKVKSKGFLKSFKHKVYEKKPERLPSLLVGSKVAWSGLHAHGGTIQGPLLVPINVGHPGAIAWQNLIRSLFRMKAAFFKEVNGKVILFAKRWAIADSNKKVMSRFRVRPAKGAKGTSADDVMPIAVLMPKVQIQARVKLEATVRGNLAGLAEAIRVELNKV